MLKRHTIKIDVVFKPDANHVCLLQRKAYKSKLQKRREKPGKKELNIYVTRTSRVARKHQIDKYQILIFFKNKKLISLFMGKI